MAEGQACDGLLTLRGGILNLMINLMSIIVDIRVVLQISVAVVGSVHFSPGMPVVVVVLGVDLAAIT